MTANVILAARDTISEEQELEEDIEAKELAQAD